MAVTTLKLNREVTRPKQWPLRTLFGVFLALLAMVGAVFVLSGRDSVPVLVATRELPAGTVLEATDLAQAAVRLDRTLLPATIPASELSTLIGRRLAEPVHAGQLLGPGEFRQGPALEPDKLAITIAPSPDRGPIGEFGSGDRVRVMVTTAPVEGTPVTRVVVESAVVYDVGYSDAFSTSEPSGGSDVPAGRSVAWLTLAVSARQAEALANAKTSGQLDVALLSPGYD